MNSEQYCAIEAATDGACSGNPGKGGWGGLIILDNGTEIEIGGGENDTTNNRMELLAAIKTLEKLRDFKLKENFKLRTDSKYLIQGYSNWINKWKANGWRTSSGKPVMNVDLWKKIDTLRLAGLKMEFVKGHSGNEHNERVDLIATNYSKGIPLQNNKLSNNYIQDKSKASVKISKLYNRMELVNKFSLKRFRINSEELSELLSLEDTTDIMNFKEFSWRDWIIKPTKDKHWIIHKKDIEFS
tara:strand:- start:33425 stop:34150 length:726 start_codon:yes stop_codon:yes gene_type:complete